MRSLVSIGGASPACSSIGAASPGGRSGVGQVLLLALLLPPGCGSGSDAPPADAGRRPARTDPENVVQDLQALGYSGETEAVGEDGVTLLERRMYPGYTLYSVQDLGLARLIDEEGEIVRTWRDPEPDARWYSAELLPSGDLLTTGVLLDEEGRMQDSERYALRLDWEGHVVWKSRVPAHHDLTRNPAGEFVTLSARRRKLPELEPGIPLIDNGLLVLDDSGQPRRSFSIQEALSRSGSWTYAPMKTENGRVVADFLHCNTIDWSPRDELAGRAPLYGPGVALVTSRHQNLVAAIDVERGEALWVFGPGILEGPHDARILEDGSVLVFDNGMYRGWSRVLEIDPLSGEIRWCHPPGAEVEEPASGGFFSASRGSCQRLPNGNTLICNSDDGVVFEVTRDHETVWRFVSPERIVGGEGEESRATLVGATRIERELVQRLLGEEGG